jgi:hypothetical protein
MFAFSVVIATETTNISNQVRRLPAVRGLAAGPELPRSVRQLDFDHGRFRLHLQLNPVTVDASAARRYAELGVNRLVVYPLPLEDPDDVLRFLERHAALPH